MGPGSGLLNLANLDSDYLSQKVKVQKWQDRRSG